MKTSHKFTILTGIRRTNYLIRELYSDSIKAITLCSMWLHECSTLTVFTPEYENRWKIIILDAKSVFTQ